MPKVDFKQFMVFGAFMGEQPTGGFKISVQDVFIEQGRLKVYLKEDKPNPKDMVIQILSAPAHLILLPKTEALVDVILQ